MKINEVHRLLTATYIDWSHILANPQYVRIDAREGSYISWNRRISRMLNHPVLASDIVQLVDDGQYTFQILEDGSVIQIYYKYEARSNELQSARLAFYSAKTDASVISNYEPRDAKGVLHHDCHMHFSAFPYSRFVVAGVPTPAQFIEFVMAFCYPEFYKEHRLNTQGTYISEEKITAINSTSFAMTESIVFSQISHFRIPTVSDKHQR